MVETSCGAARNFSPPLRCYTDDMAGYHVENFGCRTSQADGDAIASALELEQDGLCAAQALSDADVVVVNTCTVTAEADRDARAYIRKVHRAHPAARIVVTGCYAQRAPQELAAQPGVFAVVGNSHKQYTASIAAQSWADMPGTSATQTPAPQADFVPLARIAAASEAGGAVGARGLHALVFAHSFFGEAVLAAEENKFWSGAAIADSAWQPRAGRTRPSLKIQEGCGNRCTFCVIPETRGPSRSLPRVEVLRAVRSFAAAGGVEMVLTGINLGRWGRDLAPREDFADLVAAILDETPLPRLRISSVEPMDWSAALLALFARHGRGVHPRLARHAHLPLQSGSDAVLRRMHRRYRPWHYQAQVEAIHAAQPQAAIGADVMVGFPGESDAEFQESLDRIAALPFTYLHLFPFSARPGTPAWAQHREHPVPAAAVRERMQALRQLIQEKNRAFRQSLLGQPLSVVTLETSAGLRALGRTEALADNFVPVHITAELPANRLLRVQPQVLDGEALAATPLSE
jgi:threonylcarbamoyladenosine tRNA methylthiotransferase MtaB